MSQFLLESRTIIEDSQKLSPKAREFLNSICKASLKPQNQQIMPKMMNNPNPNHEQMKSMAMNMKNSHQHIQNPMVNQGNFKYFFLFLYKNLNSG